MHEYWSNCNVLATYQWIWLNKLYKLMKFFQILEAFFELANYNFLK